MEAIIIMDSEFYDRCYESWCRGKSADLDYDKWDHYRAQGFYPDEITVDMMLPQPTEPDIIEVEELFSDEDWPND